MLIGILMWLVIGGVVGWLASMLMRDNNGILMNVVVGIVGAAVGGLILGRGEINDGVLTAETFAVSLIGAVILLAAINLFRRGAIR